MPVRDLRPTHFTLKINSYSLLAATGVDKYESGVFETMGFKWRLVFYPKGKGNNNGHDDGHISLYLEIAETENFHLGWEVLVNFKLFAHDQVRDKYFFVQDTEEHRRFHEMKTEWGFNEFLPMATFKDAANGYLVDDCCAFGAEVFVCQCMGKWESLSMLKDPPNKTFTWKIPSLINLLEDKPYRSESFVVGERRWKLSIHLKGDGRVPAGLHLSFFVCLDLESLPPKRRVYADVVLRIRSHIDDNRSERSVANWFDCSTESWGFLKFISENDLRDKSKVFVMNNTLIAEAEFKVVSVSKASQ